MTENLTMGSTIVALYFCCLLLITTNPTTQIATGTIPTPRSKRGHNEAIVLADVFVMVVGVRVGKIAVLVGDSVGVFGVGVVGVTVEVVRVGKGDRGGWTGRLLVAVGMVTAGLVL